MRRRRPAPPLVPNRHLYESTRRNLIPLPGFAAAAAALGSGSPETRELLHALLRRVERQPENAPTLPGQGTRVLKTRTYGSYPAVRLLYMAVGQTIYLFDVGFYDELND